MRTFKHKLLILGCLTLFFGFLLFTLPKKPKEHTLCISCKGYEDEILAELLTVLIEQKTPYTVKRHYNLGSTFMTFNALKAKDIDLYPEYTGTVIYGLLNCEHIPKNPMSFIKKQCQEKFGIDAKLPFGFSNSYVICVTKSFAQKHNIKTISDLKKEKHLKIGMDAEFISRQDYKSLIQTYELDLNPILMDTGLLYLNLASKELDFIVANELDDEIKRFDFCVLKDDKNALPSYEGMVLVRQDTLKKHPELHAIFKLLENKISKEEYRELNAHLRNSDADLYEIACNFLKNKQLID